MDEAHEVAAVVRLVVVVDEPDSCQGAKGPDIGWPDSRPDPCEARPMGLVDDRSRHLPAMATPLIYGADLESDLWLIAGSSHEQPCVPDQGARFLPSQRKIKAFGDALRATLGVTQPDQHVVSTLYTLEGGQAAATRLLETGHTAIVCGSDLMALGAIRAARLLGLRVPEDVSIVGYDDSPTMAFVDPPLTTVRQPVQEMSATAVSSLLEELEGNPAPRVELLFRGELVVRGSTGAVTESVRALA